MKRKLITAAAAVAVGLVTFAGATVDAGGPPKDVMDANNNTWSCEGERINDAPALPPDHCMNIRSQGAQHGGTGLILVFQSDTEDRWPQEGWSMNPDVDSRPCPHDANVDGDNTWWQVPDGPYVCHHKPSTPPGRS